MSATATAEVVAEPTATEAPWTELPGGVTRRVRANRDWISLYDKTSLPFFVTEVADGVVGRTKEYAAVEVLGAVRLVASSVYDAKCGYDLRGVWLETDGPIRVK